MANRGRIPSGTVLVVATMIIAVAISAFGIYKLRGRKRTPLLFQEARKQKLTTSGNVVVAAISPAGRDLVYVTAERGREALWLHRVGDRDVEIIPPSETNYDAVSFSPDGKSIYCVRSAAGQPNAIFRLPASGGSAIDLNKTADSAITFSPDGKHMAYLRSYPEQQETALIVTPVERSEERTVAVMKSPLTFVVNAGPAWSPDGKQIAAIGRRDETDQIVVVTIADGSVNSLGDKHWQQINSLAWCVDGNSLFVSATNANSSGAQIHQMLYPSGQFAAQVTKDSEDYQQISMTRDSRLIVALQNHRQANTSVESVREVVVFSAVLLPGS